MIKHSKGKGKTPDKHRVYAPTHGDTGRSSGMDLSGFHTAKTRSHNVYAPTHEEKFPGKEEPEITEKEELDLPPNMKEAEKADPKKSKKKNSKKKKQQSKKKNSKKKEDGSLQRMLTIVITAVVIVGLLITAYFLLQIDRIIVSGSTRFSAQEIVRFADLELGSQLWLVNEEKVTDGIEEASPYLVVDSIEREYPNTLRINIRERVEAAAISYQNMTVIIDAQGHVLSIGSRGDLTGLLLVQGMSASGYTVNQRLGELTDFYTNTLISTMDALSKHEILTEIAVLDVSNPLSIVMETTSGVEVHIGQAERLDEKMDALAAVLPELDRLNLTDGTLDLSAKGDPVYSPERTPAPLPTPAPTPDPAAVTDPSQAGNSVTDPEGDDLPSG